MKRRGGQNNAKNLGQGVYLSTSGKYYARVNGHCGLTNRSKTVYLGVCDTEAEARARVAAAKLNSAASVSSAFRRAQEASICVEDMLRAAYSYDAASGVITRLLSQQSKDLGPVRNKSNRGYIRVSVQWGGKLRVFQGHRVAYLLQTGAWPKGVVDHINGIRHDNRWVNLKDTSISENNTNRAETTERRNVIRFNGRYYPLVGEGFACPHEAALVAEVS